MGREQTTAVAAGAPSIGEGTGVLEVVQAISQRLYAVESTLVSITSLLSELNRNASTSRFEKEWYTTSEVADILSKSDFTIREKWCNQGRIECEKDPYSGKWRIPAAEVRRLQAGGALRPKGPSGGP